MNNLLKCDNLGYAFSICNMQEKIDNVYIVNMSENLLEKNIKQEFFILNFDIPIINISKEAKEKMIRKMIKIVKYYSKKGKKWGYIKEKNKIIANFIPNYIKGEIDEINQNEIIVALNAITFSEKERIPYLYKKICEYLDYQFKHNNYCDFKDDICMAKRGTNGTMGCCHYYRHKYLGLLLPNDFVLCRYQKNRTCNANCITCKMFTCKELEKKGVKFTNKNVILIKIFFNPLQKIIISTSYFTHQSEIIKKLMIGIRRN